MMNQSTHRGRRRAHCADALLLALLCLPAVAAAAPIDINLDRAMFRPAMPQEGYLHFRDGGEERSGWTDVRNPAFYDGSDGASTAVNATRDRRGIGYDRSDFQVSVANVIATDRSAPRQTATPNIERDYNYANQAYGRLGVSVLSRGNRDATYDNVTFPLDGAEANRVLDANRSALPVINNYYVGGIVDAFGLTRSPEDRANHGVLIGDNPRNDTFAHELGHFLLDDKWFAVDGNVPATAGVHSLRDTDLMATGAANFRRTPNANVKSTVTNATNRPNSAPSQPGQPLGAIGGMNLFDAEVGVHFKGPPDPAGNTIELVNPDRAQIDAIFGDDSKGNQWVRRAENGATFGDRADFNWVEDNILLEFAADKAGSNRRMDNHPGFDRLTWEINAAAVGGPLAEAAPTDNLGHDHGDWGELALPGFDGGFFRTIDVVSQIARYADMDVGATGAWSAREAALDYIVQFSSNGTDWLFGTAINVFTMGWTERSQTEDWIARWTSPVDARFVRIQADTLQGSDDRNAQIDAIIASMTRVSRIPEPSSALLGATALLALALSGRFRRRERAGA